MKHHFRPWPKKGDERIRTAFLLLPMCIGEEMRWLETATWLERFDVWNYFGRWDRIQWLDPKEAAEIAQAN